MLPIFFILRLNSLPSRKGRELTFLSKFCKFSPNIGNHRFYYTVTVLIFLSVISNNLCATNYHFYDQYRLETQNYKGKYINSGETVAFTESRFWDESLL